MSEYFYLVLLVLLISTFSLSEKKHRGVLLVLCIVITFFSGFRYNVGTDYENYVKIFNGTEFYEVKEYGFKIFVLLLNAIGAKPQLMFLILAIVTVYLLYKNIVLYSENYIMSFLIFLLIPTFYLESFNGMRQVIAILIYLLTVHYVVEKKYWHIILLIGIGGFFFHESIFLVSILFFFINKSFSKKQKIVIFCLVFAFNFILETVISYTPYMNYLEIDKEVKVSIFTYLLFLISLLLVLFEDSFSNFKNKTVFFNLNFFSLLTLLIVLLQGKDVLIMMFMRFNNYFFYGFMFLLPNIVENLKVYKGRLGLNLLIVFLSMTYFYITITESGDRYKLVPFEFNFELF